jgi:hypothetical protein
MSTKIYFKETVWREVVVDITEDQRSEIFNKVTSGEIDNCDDLYDLFYEKGIDVIDNRFDYNTSEYITKEDNGGQPTIEIYDKNKNFPLPDLTN